MINMRVSTDQDSTERFAERAQSRGGLFQGWCCAAAGSLPVPSAVGLKERWDAPGSDSAMGRAAFILSSLCPFPRITVWLCL